MNLWVSVHTHWIQYLVSQIWDNLPLFLFVVISGLWIQLSWQTRHVSIRWQNVSPIPRRVYHDTFLYNCILPIHVLCHLKWFCRTHFKCCMWQAWVVVGRVLFCVPRILAVPQSWSKGWFPHSIIHYNMTVCGTFCLCGKHLTRDTLWFPHICITFSRPTWYPSFTHEWEASLKKDSLYTRHGYGWLCVSHPW